ncbi:hypothetical protein ACM0P6_15260 (plasmid) [Komagataeibacter sucrofermentans]|uniref:hypothetical protein n=1 Tax=Komagataeibacter sucrofermentans TaxID=1053551 RepID=UPI00142DA001|nr:hypothetical protein [Komagataeibacter sucrofermentans]
MTDIPPPDAADTALSFLLRVQADPAHERAWQQALRVRLLGQMALQGATQAQSLSKPTPDNPACGSAGSRYGRRIRHPHRSVN